MTTSRAAPLDQPRPAVSLVEATALAEELFGIRGTLVELGSQQDRNFRVDSAEGHFLLKVLGAGTTEADLDAQDAALAQLARDGIPVPQPREGRDGRTVQRVRGGVGGGAGGSAGGGDDLRVRLLSFLDGPSLVDRRYLAPSVVRALGELSGRVALSLGAASVEAVDRGLQWDLRRAGEVVASLAHTVPAERRVAVESATAAALARLGAVAAELRTQLIHGDLTDDNVVCRDDGAGRLTPYGVIDFGDLAEGWLVAELAVTVSSLLHHQPGTLVAALPAIRAFDAVLPLEDAEVRALWPLVVLRGAVLVVSGENQVQLEADNDYAAERMDAEWRIFEAAARLDPTVAEAMIRQALGRADAVAGGAADSDGAHDSGHAGGHVGSGGSDERAEHAWYPLVPGLGTDECAHLDLSTTSPALADGAWLSESPDDADRVEAALARELLRTNSGAADGTAAGTIAGVTSAVASGVTPGVASGVTSVVVLPYGVPRLTRATPLSAAEPATWPTVTDLFVAAGTPVSAPFAGTATLVGPHLHLSPAATPALTFITQDLVVTESDADAFRAGAEVTPGTPLGTVADTVANAVAGHGHGHGLGRLRGLARARAQPRARARPRTHCPDPGCRCRAAATPRLLSRGERALLRATAADRARLA